MSIPIFSFKSRKTTFDEKNKASSFKDQNCCDLLKYFQKMIVYMIFYKNSKEVRKSIFIMANADHIKEIVKLADKN